jgi:type IV pilus modification protein PilV
VAGFSLIEVLCAILVLGVGIVGLTHGLTTALSSTKESELQTEAALLAAGRMEMIRADGYLVDGSEEGDGDEGLGHYHWQQTISRTDIEGLHEVTVAVQQGRSEKTIYELRTLLFDPPADSTEETRERRATPESKRRDRRFR